ncbi:MAG: ABC transporter ATP-binding protein [Thermoplasmata archaeon]|nr:ABC transporter ATP-binding protein [Thermoplasmata archaeon]
MEPVIKAEEVSKHFGSFVALNAVSFSVAPGEVYGLLGPNGAGKTTLVKILNGIMKPTAGKAYVLGKDVATGKNREKVGYMPQETALYLDNTVHENLLLFGEIYGLDKGTILKREKELLDFINLSKWKNSMVANLSGGMRHRLSLACALMHEPEILFLDEPTVGVDPELRVSFWEYFYKLRKKGTTILLTTHYMDEAERCTMVGLMRNGKLIAEGKPDKLRTEIGVNTLEEVFLHYARGMEK